MTIKITVNIQQCKCKRDVEKINVPDLGEISVLQNKRQFFLFTSFPLNIR